LLWDKERESERADMARDEERVDDVTTHITSVYEQKLYCWLEAPMARKYHEKAELNNTRTQFGALSRVDTHCKLLV
jgi:hypothetical protein